MRRTNSRKRNKINIKNIDKKTLKTIYILSALIVVPSAFVTLVSSFT